MPNVVSLFYRLPYPPRCFTPHIAMYPIVVQAQPVTVCVEYTINIRLQDKRDIASIIW